MPLTLDDFRTPLFDRQKAVRRMLPARPHVQTEADEGDPFMARGEPKRRMEEAFEGTTFTDELVEVGFTYYTYDGMLTVRDMSNQELFRGVINTVDDFEESLRKAERKQRLHTAKSRRGA
jgi:hypothetical protein